MLRPCTNIAHCPGQLLYSEASVPQLLKHHDYLCMLRKSAQCSSLHRTTISPQQSISALKVKASHMWTHFLTPSLQPKTLTKITPINKSINAEPERHHEQNKRLSSYGGACFFKRKHYLKTTKLHLYRHTQTPTTHASQLNIRMLQTP